jgi:hypothetical protein
VVDSRLVFLVLLFLVSGGFVVSGERWFCWFVLVVVGFFGVRIILLWLVV